MLKNSESACISAPAIDAVAVKNRGGKLVAVARFGTAYVRLTVDTQNPPAKAVAGRGRLAGVLMTDRGMTAESSDHAENFLNLAARLSDYTAAWLLTALRLNHLDTCVLGGFVHMILIFISGFNLYVYMHL